MTNIVYENLYRKMVETGVSFAILSDAIGISKDVFVEKMEGKQPWLLSEAVAICAYFETSDVNFLFCSVI